MYFVQSGGTRLTKPNEIPVTQAVRVLREEGISFVPHPYAYQEHGGTSRASSELEVPEHHVIKTLVFQTDRSDTLLVLMHGDREVSTKQLARSLGVKEVTPCDPAKAQRLTGYMVGGISPFGTRTRLPVYAEETIFELPRIFINGGKRGFLVELAPADVDRVLHTARVRVGLAP